MVNYGQGKIYKLVNNCDDKIYVGSTCNALRKRKAEHKANLNRCHERQIYKHLNSIGWENVEIVIIEYFPCANKQELHARERHFIKTLKPELNKNIPGRTPEEWKLDNKTIIAVKDKARYIKNQDAIAKRQKAFYSNNKEAILATAKEYRVKNRDIIAAKKKVHNKKNREKILTKNKAYYEEKKESILAKKKEKITCECGSSIRKCGKARHLKTKKHKRVMNLRAILRD